MMERCPFEGCEWSTLTRYAEPGTDALAEHIDLHHERRARDQRGVAHVVPNEVWSQHRRQPLRWCVRPGGIIPRLHRREHYVLFDPGLPYYGRCLRCGDTAYFG